MWFKPRVGSKGKEEGKGAFSWIPPRTGESILKKEIPNIPMPPGEAEIFVREFFDHKLENVPQYVKAFKRTKKNRYYKERDRIFLRFAMYPVENALVKIKSELEKKEKKEDEQVSRQREQ